MKGKKLEDYNWDAIDWNSYDIWANNNEFIRRNGEIYIAAAKGEEYTNKYNITESDFEEFSWVVTSKGNEKEKIRECIENHYGIPQQVVGNLNKASLFHCLYNPRTNIVSDNLFSDDLEEYIRKQTGCEEGEVKNTNNEFFDTPDEYISHIVDVDENIIYKELKKTKEMFLRKNINIYSKKFEDEFRLKAYYLSNYYKALFPGEDKQRINMYNFLYKGFTADPDFHERFKNFGLCNLELIPYRSNDIKRVKLTKEAKENASFYAVSIIIKRIVSSPDENISFVFRSYSDWEKMIKKFIGMNIELLLNEKVDKKLKKSETENILKLLSKNRFFRTHTSGVISYRNLLTLDKKSVGHKYEDIIKTLNIEGL